MRKFYFNAYELAIRSIPVLCVTGFITLMAGSISKNQLGMQIGTCLFLSGFAVWGLANGGGLLWALTQTIRQRAFRIFKEQPFVSAFFVFFMLFLLYVGFQFVWMCLGASRVTK
jgi:hypothetical protein